MSKTNRFMFFGQSNGQKPGFNNDQILAAEYFVLEMCLRSFLLAQNSCAYACVCACVAIEN